MLEGIPSILVGHTGIAKTEVLRRVHQEAGWPYRHVNGRESLEADNLLGKWRLEDGNMVFKLGILPFCMLNGIALGIQEINYVAPEVLVLLHELFDEGFITLDELSPDDEHFIVRPDANFRLFGTMNPPDLYPGARDLSPAFLRRCLVRHVDVLDEATETDVIKSRCDWLAESDIVGMVNVANEVRSKFGVESSFWLSTADLIVWGRVAKHMPVLDAAETAIIGKAQDEDDIASTRGFVRLNFDPDGV